MLNKSTKRILELLYRRKEQMHLREIAKELGMNENSAYKNINLLTEENILKSEKKGNMRLLSMQKSKKAYWISSFFDIKRYEALPNIRKIAVEYFLENLPEQPIFVVMFGSTARNTFRDESDIDIVLVTNQEIDVKGARDKAEAQSSISINSFQITYMEFRKELKMRNDPVIQSALKHGFPLLNHIRFYEVIDDVEA